MPAEFRIGPPTLTIHQGSAIMVTDQTGEIVPHAQQGLFAHDTRFVSLYQFVINGQHWLPLQADAINYCTIRVHLTNPRLTELEDDPIPPQTLGFTVDRRIGHGVHEDLRITNFSSRTINCRFRIKIDSDFADLFDVRSGDFFSRGVRDSFWDSDKSELRIKYTHEDFERELIYSLSSSAPCPHFSNGQILFELVLAPGASWNTCALFTFVINGARMEPLYPCHGENSYKTTADNLLLNWKEQTTSVSSSHYELRTIYAQAVSDVGALRIHEHDFARDVWIPAAGVPWFVALFGRDSLISSLQSMMVAPRFALGALAKLAQLQANADDPYRDAEPGKIMHEIRHGELAHFHLVPHTPYYGTADATILYLIVLSEMYRWTGDKSLLERFREPAMRCLSWIDRYGDRDGDGFQEYKTRSIAGYYNQGWKDAGDAVVYPDGSLVKLPIATCELQGYVYDAKLRMAEILEALGDGAGPERLRKQAEELRARFNAAFWVPEENYLAYCLDGDKRPVATVASNPGHCLWSGIVTPEHAKLVAQRMFQDDMWSGWGVRTLSANNPSFDPLEYQRGSVWPHDNGFIAAGLARYGFRDLAAQVASGIFDAAALFTNFRLPELFCGFSRTQNRFPVQYINANAPQAWASGSVFHLLRTLLGIHADAAHGKLYLDPWLPDWLEDLTLHNLQVGDARVDIRFDRTNGKSNFKVVSTQGRLEVVQGSPRWAGV